MAEVAHLEEQARNARAQYEASVQALQRRLADLPAVSERYGALEQRLAGLEKEAAALHAKMNAGMSATYQPPSRVPPKETPKPVSKAARRASRMSSASFEDLSGGGGIPSGRVVVLNTGSELLGPLECILAEPIGKQLSPDDFVATGLVICLHGNAPSSAVLDEWGTAIKQAKWLELGISVALPNLEMTSALTLSDLESVVQATLELTGLGTCVLVGKAWGALRAVEIASSQSLASQIEGLILVAPSSPPPMVSNNVDAPVLIVWAVDDDTEAFVHHDEWLDVLDGREGPTTMLEAQRGGHNFGNLMERPDVVEGVKNFMVASLLHADLESDQRDDAGMSERAQRLKGELPGFLLAQSASDDVLNSSEAVQKGASAESRSSNRRLSALLPQWVQSGMPTSSE